MKLSSILGGSKCETVVNFAGGVLQSEILSPTLGVGGFRCETVVNFGGWRFQSVKLSSTLGAEGFNVVGADG